MYYQYQQVRDLLAGGATKAEVAEELNIPLQAVYTADYLARKKGYQPGTHAVRPNENGTLFTLATKVEKDVLASVRKTGELTGIEFTALRLAREVLESHNA